MSNGWNNTAKIESLSFECGFCNNKVASEIGFFNNNRIDGLTARIRICPHCSKPTFFLGSNKLPDISPGNDVKSVPEEVHALYQEARNCISISAYTASVLISRKLLMNISVSQGAKENLRFIEYVDFLAENGFVPPNGRGWVDHIRKKGNEATHEISLMDRDDATELVTFSEMLLKFIFEFPASVPALPSA